jgi:predicted DNA-binding transcriptional regulator YafY
MERLLAAMKPHRVCEVVYREHEYRHPDREPRQYQFVPVRFSAENEVINAEGWLVTDNDSPAAVHPLTLALHRILACEPTTRSLSPCPALPEYEGAFGLVGNKGFPVRVAFCEEFGGFIKERYWSQGQEIVDLPDGGVELRFHASDENELMGWVLSFGNGAELVEPVDIRRKLLGEIRDLLDMYAEG